MTFSKIIIYIRPIWQIRLQNIVVVISYFIKQSCQVMKSPEQEQVW